LRLPGRGNAGQGHSSRENGFTLVEILISVVIVGIIGGAAASLLYTYIGSFEQTSDYVTARQRAEGVLAILERPILHASLGIPESPDNVVTFADYATKADSVYQKAFTDSTGGPVVKDWRHPVFISPDNALEGPEIRIVYAMPSGVVQTEQLSVSDSSVFSLDLSPDVDTLFETAAPSIIRLDSWITFPTLGYPLYVSGGTPAVPKVRRPSTNTTAGFIAAYDELLYVRALRACVVTDSGGSYFATEDVTSESGTQKRIEGIRKLHFSFDPFTGVLVVFVLAQGNKRYASEVVQSLDGWPSSADAISSDDRHYRLAIASAAWRLRNTAKP
jgi:prepilin-type N-terminal cleavage/methylation domain-containing protein